MKRNTLHTRPQTTCKQFYYCKMYHWKPSFFFLSLHTKHQKCIWSTFSQSSSSTSDHTVLEGVCKRKEEGAGMTQGGGSDFDKNMCFYILLIIALLWKSYSKCDTKTKPIPSRSEDVRVPENRNTKRWILEHPAGGTNLLDYTAQLAGVTTDLWLIQFSWKSKKKQNIFSQCAAAKR